MSGSPVKTEGSSPFLTDANLNMLRSTIGCADGTMDALLIDEVFRLRRELTASEKDAARYRHIKAHAAVSFDDEIRWTTATGAVIFTHSAAQHELDLITDAAILAKGDRS